MFYTPHLLYKRDARQYRDEFNRIKENYGRWILVGECRCDDNDGKVVRKANGDWYVYQYHIVCEAKDVALGDYLKVTDKFGNVRGEGKVINRRICNYLNYVNVYV